MRKFESFFFISPEETSDDELEPHPSVQRELEEIIIIIQELWKHRADGLATREEELIVLATKRLVEAYDDLEGLLEKVTGEIDPKVLEDAKEEMRFCYENLDQIFGRTANAPTRRYAPVNTNNMNDFVV